jgi:carbamoyltransferase
MPHSIGLFYSAFTAFLGFEVNEGEYKVMGMAGFGRATRGECVRSMVEFAVDGFVQLRDEFFNFACPADVPFTPALSSVLGKPRSAESPFKLPIDRDGPMDDVERESLNYADIAASVQVVVEDMILHVVRGAISRTGLTNVCLAGGVALNSLANARIKREITEQLYIQPAAGDAGAALGAALAWHHRNPKAPRLPPLHSAFLGREYAIEEIRAALNESGPYVVERIDNPSEYAKRVAEALEHGEVIGWVQGRFEWGPRSLGARSILADPRDTQMQSRVNEKIKFREPFRPFAPIVLAERADEFFELPTSRTPSSPESFMLSVWPVRQPARDRIPAVTHVDGTARVQLVRREDSPLLHSLLSAFADSTGIPVLLNTSFNRRGEPIVASPADAVKTFDWTGLDVLAIGPFLVRKTTELP